MCDKDLFPFNLPPASSATKRKACRGAWILSILSSVRIFFFVFFQKCALGVVACSHICKAENGSERAAAESIFAVSCEIAKRFPCAYVIGFYVRVCLHINGGKWKAGVITRYKECKCMRWLSRFTVLWYIIVQLCVYACGWGGLVFMMRN